MYISYFFYYYILYFLLGQNKMNMRGHANHKASQLSTTARREASGIRQPKLVPKARRLAQLCQFTRGYPLLIKCGWKIHYKQKSVDGKIIEVNGGFSIVTFARRMINFWVHHPKKSQPIHPPSTYLPKTATYPAAFFFSSCKGAEGMAKLTPVERL